MGPWVRNMAWKEEEEEPADNEGLNDKLTELIHCRTHVHALGVVVVAVRAAVAECE